MSEEHIEVLHVDDSFKDISGGCGLVASKVR